MSILQPRDDRFYVLFEEAAANVRRGAEMLLAMLHDYTEVAAKAKAIKDVEHQGDILTHEMYEHLNKAFVTPLDREDIAAIASKLDDVLDLVEASADDFVVCNVEKPLPAAIEMADIIVRSTVKVQEAFSYLRRLSKARSAMRECLSDINTLENEGDAVYRVAVQDLFSQPEPILIIKWKQIYDHQERAIDMCENVADVLQGMLLKYA
ncbi:MAG: phosphate transport regulator [Ktedonobacterales bacterium]|jgi:uncharacterized protein Yka (UPF0111/DUF47 family)|nr:MAG: phosphate transport regulator [Ktedonobacterales bacterium]